MSNYLFIRTRERLLLENKVHAPAKVLKGSTFSLNAATTQSALKELNKDVETNLNHLSKLLFVLTPELNDLPVAFASNALYVLERNGLTDRENYERLLLPVLKKKIEYLHAEGVAQAVWALSNAEIWDS